MSLFKPKHPVEEEVARLFGHAMPRALEFLTRDNQRAPRPVRLPEAQIAEIGAGMLMFFLAAHLPDPEKDKHSTELMQRAFIQAQTELKRWRASPERAHGWWKAFTDALIFRPTDDRLGLACTLVWEKIFEGKPYREPNPLHSFGYILQMETAEVKKCKLV